MTGSVNCMSDMVVVVVDTIDGEPIRIERKDEWTAAVT